MAGDSRRKAAARNIGGECGTVIQKGIVAQVLAGGNVVGRAGIENHKWTQAKPTRQPDCAAHEQPIPGRKRSSPVIHAQIVLIRWKVRGAGSIAVGVVQRVVTEQRQLGASSDVEIRDQLILAEDSIRRVLIDRTLAWEWIRPGRARCPRQRGVDVQG